MYYGNYQGFISPFLKAIWSSQPPAPGITTRETTKKVASFLCRFFLLTRKLSLCIAIPLFCFGRLPPHSFDGDIKC